MNINVFLLCFNESALLPHTIKHYKKYLPSCKITIYDNESEDNSVEIAINLGCNIVSWTSNNIHNEFTQINLRNNIWKQCKDGWIIMADMDEFVCVTEDDLQKEMDAGTTILNIKGYNMIGESKTVDLSDIDLQEINKCVFHAPESKHLCFLREAITDMNYGPGSHSCQPKGAIIYSSTVYINKHMSYLGLPFITKKYVERYERNNEMRKTGTNMHYTNDISDIENRYNNALNQHI
jgi:hypothetical protein